jgi:ribokinase
VITNGAKGGRVWIDGKKKEYEGKKYHDVVDTTGAGDAFASGYISALLYGYNYERAIGWGLENAGGILRHVGAKKGLLTLAQIKNF